MCQEEGAMGVRTAGALTGQSDHVAPGAFSARCGAEHGFLRNDYESLG